MKSFQFYHSADIKVRYKSNQETYDSFITQLDENTKIGVSKELLLKLNRSFWDEDTLQK